MKLVYCNSPQKHIVAGGSTEEEELVCDIVRDVLRPRKGPKVVIFYVGPENR